MSDLAVPLGPHRLPGSRPSRFGRFESAYYAALDLGTNNCRLLVGAPTPRGFRVVDSFSRIVRLGEGLVATGRLSETAMDRAVEALTACAEKLQRRPLRGFAAVATEACRRAVNGAEFLRRVTRETGITPRVIGAREEAQLALASCAPLLTPGDRRAILFDIGGGSTEIAWVRLAPVGAGNLEPTLIGTISIPVGVVTLAERVGDSCFTREGFAAVRDEVAERLRGFDAVHCIGQEIHQGGVRLIGTSGTVTTLAGTVLDLPRYRRQWVDGVCLDAKNCSPWVAPAWSTTPASARNGRILCCPAAPSTPPFVRSGRCSG